MSNKLYKLIYNLSQNDLYIQNDKNAFHLVETRKLRVYAKSHQCNQSEITIQRTKIATTNKATECIKSKAIFPWFLPSQAKEAAKI